jgi:hypothetical protein
MKNRPVSRSPNCWLSVMLPPRLASSPDTAATIPGRSGQDRVSTNSVISEASGSDQRPARRERASNPG